MATGQKPHTDIHARLQSLGDWSARFAQTPDAAALAPFAEAFSLAYRDAFPPEDGVADAQTLQALPAEPPLALKLARGTDARQLQLKLYGRGQPASLSRVLPLLENIGFTVESVQPYAIAPDYWLQQYTLTLPAAIAPEAVESRLADAFRRIWTGTTDSDRLNALLLTACGGDKDQNDRLPYDPSRPQTDNNIDYSKAYHGTGYAVSSRSSINPRSAAQILNGNSLDTVRIDGNRLPARQVGIYTSGVPRLRANTPITVEGVSYKNFLISGEHYQNSRFGYITRDNTDYIFSQGALTQNMPSTGIARYDGEAIVGRNGQTDAADAKFIASFGSRSLSGRIIPLRDSKVAFSEVNFNASIDGNSFYNNGLSVGTNGNFYGDNARELGGVFYDNNQELRGSFGATRR